MGRIATLPCTMAVVRCPSLPAAINTEKGEDKWREGGDDFFEKERNETGGQNNFGEGEKYYRRGDGRF
jgi:hypothetical protein